MVFPSYYTIAAIEPADGSTGFARDGAVRVQLIATWIVDGSGSYESPFQLTVTRVDTGEIVAGRAQLGADAALRWLPDQLLAADTQYRVDVVTADQQRADIDGTVTGSSTFTTGGDVSAPIAFEGELRVAGVRAGTAEPCSTNWIDCGYCGADGGREIRVVYADLDLPAVSGGFTAYGYSVSVSPSETGRPLDGGYPRLFNSEAIWSLVTADVPERWTVLLPPRGHAYAPCFELRVADSVGHERSTSVCSDEIDVEALLNPDASAPAPRSEPGEAASADVDGGPAADAGASADAGTPDPDGGNALLAGAQHRTSVDASGDSNEGDCSVTQTDGPRLPGLAAPSVLAWLALRIRRRLRGARA